MGEIALDESLPAACPATPLPPQTIMPRLALIFGYLRMLALAHSPLVAHG
jgi:hypothetical protein